MSQTDQIKKGMYIDFRSEPHLVIEASLYSPGKGSAFTRTRLKGLLSDKTTDFNFRSGEKVEEIDLNTREMQYLYSDVNYAYFMDPQTFEQKTLPKERLGSLLQFLKEGDTCLVLVQDDEAVTIRPPGKVKLKVTEAEEAVKGNTSSGATKSVVVETGVAVTVPLFIKKGDVILINPESGEYVERA